MEYRYYRELKHNYLVFENRNEETSDERYQYRIMESGRIKSLVPCARRNINGEKFFYYEINSMQSIKDRFSATKMDHQQLQRLLSDIKELMDGLSEFLLGQEGIVFNAQSVFTDLATGEYKFLYCPFFDEKKSFSDFAMELLDIVDEGDQQATDLIYRLCEESANRGDFIYEVIESVTEVEEAELKADEYEDVKPSRQQPVFDDDFFEEDEIEDPPAEKESRLKKANKRLSGKLQLFFSLMFMFLVGAMVYIRMNYILSSEENILSIVVMVVSAITGTIALVGGFKEMKKEAPTKDASEKDDEDDFDEDYEEEDYFSDREDEGEDTARFTRSVQNETVSFPKRGMVSGETVVLDQEESQELALFSRNLDKTVRIPLQNLPVTIGKMEGCVDVMLSDPSVSRMHCRIEEKQGRVCIRDLGSTNGCFRNGLRLKVQEMVQIDEGDEIRIGRVCFDCR
ncbi:FHA domain-containing protein [Butyrivibrio sp. CB08]|uniref:DUF6382 domain-containing protein n=1 Tax=Butyrivibrio sp. CB08 TaxID=2364879 RepID=UPI000EA864F0|nr:DUF6382 domain-containing protein [Butyrivibrio sp. CB08]RKM55081.1 FHA domain-containing protein [Butyrivibrio sp. CB08]